MCLTAEALMLFLSILPEDRIDVGFDRVVIRAETRDAVWVAEGERWCTDAPVRTERISTTDD